MQEFKENESLMLEDFHWNAGLITGAIHVGANIGEERFDYEKHHLNVMWFEPNPEAFAILSSNISKCSPKQWAYPFLISDKDDKEYILHVASNNGASSSILDRANHKEAWPNISYIKNVVVRSITLNTFFKNNGIPKKKNVFSF